MCVSFRQSYCSIKLPLLSNTTFSSMQMHPLEMRGSLRMAGCLSLLDINADPPSLNGDVLFAVFVGPARLSGSFGFRWAKVRTLILADIRGSGPRAGSRPLRPGRAPHQ